MISFKVDDLKFMNAELKTFLDFLEDEEVCEDGVFDSRLVACELITNVLRHEGETALFSGALCGDRVEIFVSSEGGGASFSVRATLPDVFAESGRGLYIINALCDGKVTLENGGVKAEVTVKRK